MHIVIINGSPRVQKFSNTGKIIKSFGQGLQAYGITFELYSLSNRKEWNAALEAFCSREHIIFALPLYVECVPSMMLEFMESLPPRNSPVLNISKLQTDGTNKVLLIQQYICFIITIEIGKHAFPSLV